MSKEERIRGVIKKCEKGLIQLKDGEFFSISKEKCKGLTEGLEVELLVKGRNVVNIRILSEVKGKKNNKGSEIKLNQNTQTKKKENIKKVGIYISPEYLRDNLEEIHDNFYLSINKYAFASVENPKKESVSENYDEAFEQFLDGKLKLKIENIPNITKTPNSEKIRKFIDIYIKTIENLGTNGNFEIKERDFRPNSKLIIGLGAPSVYEVSMTLHHVYGFPYIPAQAIKGVLRNYFINKYFDIDVNERLQVAKEELKKENINIEDVDKLNKEEKAKVYKKIGDKKEKIALKNPIFEFIFGSQDNEGNIIFFDTFPTGDIKLQVDIMNNHFPDYYENDEPPADWQNPKPIKFLVVKDTPFKIFIGIKKNVNLEKLKEKLNKFKEKEEFKKREENHKKFIEDFEDKLDSKESILSRLLNHLEKAFEWYGVGAKTSIGYGYLSKEN